MQESIIGKGKKEMKIEYLDPEDLILYNKNTKKHPKEQLELTKKAIS